MPTFFKKLTLTLALVACSASFAAMAQDKLTIGVDTAFVPFEFKKGDKYVGFDIDLWDAIAKKMHVSYELRPMDFSGLIPGLQSRNLDVAMAGITITDARKQVIDFSNGYYNADLLIAVKKVDNGITRFSDLAGKKVGLKQGTAAASFMKKNIKRIILSFQISTMPILICRQVILTPLCTTLQTFFITLKRPGMARSSQPARQTAFCHSNTALPCKKTAP